MSLAPGGSVDPPNSDFMKIMLWNFHEEKCPEFRRALCFLLNWNTPTMLCLTETKKEDHGSVLDEFNYTDLIQASS